MLNEVSTTVSVIAERVRTASAPGRRTDAHRVALAVEGGSSRGAYAGGMLLGLEELGLVAAFDAVYGSSAGALGAAWLLAGNVRTGVGIWTDPVLMGRVMNPRNLLRRRPIVDLDPLLGDSSAVLPRAVIDSPVEFHPLATDAATGLSTDLRPFIHDDVTLRTALRASAALPALTGPPVRLAGRRFIDASIAEPLPYRTALAQGATHVLLLRTRPHTAVPMPAPLAERLIIPWFLRAQAGGALDAWRDYYHRWVRDDEALADHPTVLSLRPPAGEGEIGLVETDVDLLRNAIGTGRRAAHMTFGFLARDNACA